MLLELELPIDLLSASAPPATASGVVVDVAVVGTIGRPVALPYIGVAKPAMCKK